MKKILFILGVILFVSCSSDDHLETPPNPEATLLQKIIVTENNLSTFQTFEYTGNYLVRETSGFPDTYANYSYTGNLITGMAYYTNDELRGNSVFQYDSQERMVMRLETSIDDDSASRTDYAYDNTNGSVLATSYFGDLAQQLTMYDKRRYYFDNDVVVKTEYLDINDDSVQQIIDYTYDGKNSPFNAIIGFQKLTWTNEHVLGATKNPLTISYSTPSTTPILRNSIDYSYNNSDFPTQSTTYNPDGSIHMQSQYIYQ